MQILTDEHCESLQGGSLVRIGDIAPSVNVNLTNQLQNQFGFGLFGGTAINAAGQLFASRR